MISQLRQKVREQGSVTITPEEFDQLQAEWIMRIGFDPDAVIASQRDMLVSELGFIANAKRFNKDCFDSDTGFADWAQSRARHSISVEMHPDKKHPKPGQTDKPTIS